MTDNFDDFVLDKFEKGKGGLRYANPLNNWELHVKDDGTTMANMTLTDDNIEKMFQASLSVAGQQIYERFNKAFEFSENNKLRNLVIEYLTEATDNMEAYTDRIIDKAIGLYSKATYSETTPTEMFDTAAGVDCIEYIFDKAATKMVMSGQDVAKMMNAANDSNKTLGDRLFNPAADEGGKLLGGLVKDIGRDIAGKLTKRYTGTEEEAEAARQALGKMREIVRTDVKEGSNEVIEEGRNIARGVTRAGKEIAAGAAGGVLGKMSNEEILSKNKKEEKEPKTAPTETTKPTEAPSTSAGKGEPGATGTTGREEPTVSPEWKKMKVTGPAGYNKGDDGFFEELFRKSMDDGHLDVHAHGYHHTEESDSDEIKRG